MIRKDTKWLDWCVSNLQIVCYLIEERLLNHRRIKICSFWLIQFLLIVKLPLDYRPLDRPPGVVVPSVIRSWRAWSSSILGVDTNRPGNPVVGRSFPVLRPSSLACCPGDFRRRPAAEVASSGRSWAALEAGVVRWVTLMVVARQGCPRRDLEVDWCGLLRGFWPDVTELDATDWLVDGTEDASVGRVLGWWVGALWRSSSWWLVLEFDGCC